MRDERINPGEAISQSDALNPEEAFQKELDARLVRALEARPETAIPTSFAARVASQMPARRPVLLRPTHYGQRAMVLCLVVLAVVVLGLALHNIGHTTMGLTMEWLCAHSSCYSPCGWGCAEKACANRIGPTSLT